MTDEVKDFYNVIIIGAGVAGLAAGKHLYESGYKKFVILEGADNIGGRIRTTEVGDEKYPTGAGWLHGCKNNPIYDIAEEIGIQFEECPIKGDNIFYVFNSLTKRNVTKKYLIKYEQLSKEIDEIADKYADDVIEDKAMSIHDFLADKINVFGKNVSPLEKTVLFTTLEIYFGEFWKNVSAYSVLKVKDDIYDETEGVRNFRMLESDGISKVINYLSKDILEKIHLNTYVDKIKWYGANGRGVKVITREGKVIHGKWLIVTVQSSLLLENKIKFEPEIPKWKKLAWKSVPAVDYCRLIAKWDQENRFWGHEEWLINVTNDPQQDLVFWQNLSGQNCRFGYNSLVCHLTGGGCHPTRFYEMSEDQLKEEVQKSLSSLYNQSVPYPEHVKLVSHWNEGGRWKGAFSCCGLQIGENSVKDLAAPLSRMLFAGESTLISLLGTLQGAYVSGKNAANHILSQ